MYNKLKWQLPVTMLWLMITLVVLNSCGGSNTSTSPSANDTAKPSGDGFVTIFDGKTLNGWEGDTSIWKVVDGVITGMADSPLTLKANTFLIWKNGRPADFELFTDYRISKSGNSGIQYRSDTVTGVPFGLRGYQADIDGENNYTGQNYEERGRTTLAYRGQKVTIPTVKDAVSKGNAWSAMQVVGSCGDKDSLKTKIKDDWNECHLVIRGNLLQHYVNGILMSEVTDNDSTHRKMSGLLGMQIHAGHVMKVEYRNIRIKQF